MYISSLYDFSVSFEAVKGKGWSGDIALDDIKVISIDITVWIFVLAELLHTFILQCMY